MGNDVKVFDCGQGEAPAHVAHRVRERRGSELSGGYQPSRRLRWILFGLIAVIHFAGFYALQHLNVYIVRQLPVPLMIVDLLPLDPPPPEPVALPKQKMVQQVPKPQQVVIPPPLVEMPAAPAMIRSISKPEPEPPAPVKAEDANPAPPRASETLVNLNTRLLSAEPPRYPIESRRRRETGTVVLMVVVNEEGRVSAISVATGSGVDRLDKAALSAVRRWRWSPMVIDGRPAQVCGLVRIPFELKDARFQRSGNGMIGAEHDRAVPTDAGLGIPDEARRVG